MNLTLAHAQNHYKQKAHFSTCNSVEYNGKCVLLNAKCSVQSNEASEVGVKCEMIFEKEIFL